MFAERWPSGEFLAAEAAHVTLGEPRRSMPHEAAGVFEGLETSDTNVCFVGAFGFVFAPFTGMLRDAVVQKKVFGGESWSALGKAAVELVWCRI